MAKFLENTSYSIINSILQLFVSIISGMLIARMLGPEGKGVLYLISQIVTIGAVFFSFGTGSSLLYFLRKHTLSKNQAITFSIIYLICITLLISFISIFGKDTILILLNKSLTFGMLCFGLILILLNLLVNLWGFILMSNDAGIKLLSIFTIIGSLVYLAFLIVLVYFLSMGIFGTLIALLSSILVRIILMIKYIFTSGYYFKSISANNVKLLFKYGFGIFIGNLFLTGIYRIDIFFVNSILSVSEVGIYSVAVNISELLLLIPSAIGVVLFPHLTSMDINDQRQTMSRIGRMSLVLGLVGSFILVTITYPFIIIVFGDKFISAFIPTLLLIPGLVALTLNFAYSNYLFSLGKPFAAAKIFAVGLMVNTILNVTLLKKLGINGAAIFSSITYSIITAGFMLHIAKSDDQIKLVDICIPNKQDFTYITKKVRSIIESVYFKFKKS